MQRLISGLKFYGFVAGIAAIMSGVSFVSSALQIKATPLLEHEATMQPTLADAAVPPHVVAAVAQPIETPAVVAPKPSIIVVDPPMGTKEVWRIVLRGENWGPYNNRMNPEVFLVNAQKTDEVYPMKVDRNYRDCTILTTNDTLEQKCVEELFLAVMFTDEAKKALPGDYFLYVQNESGQGAEIPFVIVSLPDLSKSIQPTLAITPNHGRIGTYVVLSAGGFAKRSSLVIHLDGVKIGGTPMTDENGFFSDVGIVIPQWIEVKGTPVAITPGVHTIDVENFGSVRQSAQATFTVDGAGGIVQVDDSKKLQEDKKQQEDAKKQLDTIAEKEKKLEKQKETLEKQTEVLVKKQKKTRLNKTDVKRLDALKKEQAKKQQELLAAKKKTDDAENRKDAIDQVVRVDMYQGKPCGGDLPITFQPGCVPLGLPTTSNPYEGKVCRLDMTITFQPGCTPGEAPKPSKLYEGKPCDAALPRVWQEGCVEQPKPAASTAIPSQDKKCSPLIPAYAQKGCVK